MVQKRISDSIKEPSIKKINKKNWRKGYGPNEKIQRIRPQESFEEIINPHKGTTTFQRFNGDALYPALSWSDADGPIKFKTGPISKRSLKNIFYPPTTVSYCRWLWSAIEPKKGQYNWHLIEGALQQAEACGQTLQLRIQPYINGDQPSFFWDLGGKRLKNSYNKGYAPEPDINHPSYIKHWGDFIKAFAKKFDGHPNLESFDIAYGGPFGEMGGNANNQTASALANIYLKAFKKTTLVSMLGTHGCTSAEKNSKIKPGWRCDCIGDLRKVVSKEVPYGYTFNHMFDEYPKQIHVNGVKDRWKTAPVTLETCGVVGGWLKAGYDIDWIIEQMYKYHPTFFMPKSCYFPKEWDDKFKEFHRRIGYHFVLRQVTMPLDVSMNKKIKFECWIDNVGVAPIYRKYPLAFRFSNENASKIVLSKQDITSWMPDHNWFKESISIPKEIKKGTVKINFALVDPISMKPKVKLAIKEIEKDNWHPIGYFNLKGE